MRVLFVVATLLLALGCQGTEGDPIASGGAEVRSVSDCPSDYRVINGTKRNDVLFGTHGNDCILGQAGNDWIYGLGGDDYLAGGRGKDVLVGGLGADDLSGGPGHDVLFGGPGDDLIRGGGDGDLVFAGIGDDIVRGGDGDDTIHGNPGDDELCGGRGNDWIRGGLGDDMICGDEGADDLSGGPGHDVLFGGPGHDVIDNPGGIDTVIDGVGNADVEFAFNAWPIVESIVATPTRLSDGETTLIATDIFDPDGDVLTFAWTADCEGAFSATDAAEPSFTLTTVTTEECTFAVDVSDGQGGDVTGTFTIATGAVPVNEE